MKYDICILSRDELYAQWLLLSLSEDGKSVTVSESANTAPSSKIYIVDLDSAGVPKKENSDFLCFSADREKAAKHAGLVRPFSIEELTSALSGALLKSDEETQDGDRVILFGGRHVQLTEREYELYSILANAKGESVARDKICRCVWGCDDTESLNIYIHYLRKKLEQNGVNAIRSHRGKGYSLILR